MRITSKGEYGLRALFDLAQRHGTAPATSADIAARQKIPEAYLNQLLITMRKKGLVRSVRGPHGGHRLARSPARITLADAVLALEGDLSPTGQLDTPTTPDDAGDAGDAGILHEVWREVEAAIRQMLESVTLDDLCQRKLAREQTIMYYI